jgi:hypothetical protein
MGGGGGEIRPASVVGVATRMRSSALFIKSNSSLLRVRWIARFPAMRQSFFVNFNFRLILDF